MEVRKNLPAPPEPTYDLLGLTEEQLKTIIGSLLHCSGGHIQSFCQDGTSKPGVLYNQLSAMSQVQVGNIKDYTCPSNSGK
jgi:hypothetical protein